MKTLHKLLTATILAGSCLTASAQALHSGYFLEGYTFRHQLNPAFSAERNYVSVPVLGNINVGTQGNVAWASSSSRATANSLRSCTPA